MRTALARIGIAVGGLLLGSTAEPCDAMRIYLPAREALEAYRYVYVAKVVATHSMDSWTVELVRVWKGSWPGDPKRIQVENGAGMCGAALSDGEHYLIYANDEDVGRYIPIPLRSEQARKEVADLDRVLKRQPLTVPEEALRAPKS
jgi:hypothetical protein